MPKKLRDMTLREISQHYNSDKCEVRCTCKEYCHLHMKNCCAMDVTNGEISDKKFGDLIEEILNQEEVVHEEDRIV